MAGDIVWANISLFPDPKQPESLALNESLMFATSKAGEYIYSRISFATTETIWAKEGFPLGIFTGLDGKDEPTGQVPLPPPTKSVLEITRITKLEEYPGFKKYKTLGLLTRFVGGEEKAYQVNCTADLVE